MSKNEYLAINELYGEMKVSASETRLRLCWNVAKH